MFGIDRLLADPELAQAARRQARRACSRIRPRSPRDLTHSLDALVAAGINVTAAFGPQHGVRGDKQDNMVESPDFTDPTYGIPVFSLYGEVRRPTGQSMGTFDTILVDLQDLGCRIYTFSRRCSTCSRPRPSTARASGCSTGPIPPAGRSRG